MKYIKTNFTPPQAKQQSFSIKVRTKAESQKVQKYLFQHGFSWHPPIQHTHQEGYFPGISYPMHIDIHVHELNGITWSGKHPHTTLITFKELQQKLN